MKKSSTLTLQDKLDKAIRKEFADFSQVINIYRVVIIKQLSLSEQTFKELKWWTKCSDGNLASHMRVLEQKGLVEVIKGFDGRRPKTTYKLTPKGDKFTKQFLKELEAIITVVSLKDSKK